MRRKPFPVRKGPTGTERVLDLLSKAGWLRKVSTPSDDPKGQGQTIHRWQVNPALFQMKTVLPKPAQRRHSRRIMVSRAAASPREKAPCGTSG